MPENNNGSTHLRTKYVFIDTQAFRKARCDWDGPFLSKLAELAKDGQLRLLVTDITKREVRSQLRELHRELKSALGKNRGIAKQLDASGLIEAVADESIALKKLEDAFDQFLQRTETILVPLIPDMASVLDDYFAQRPPFSAKKKHEFPDAISIASIRAWCQQNRSTAYVVSEDADLKACCSDVGPLFHVETIPQIISKATVSQALHDALLKALQASDELSDELADEIKNLDVEIERSFRRKADIVRAAIENVHSINVLSVNVLEQDNGRFICELEIEAEVALEMDLELGFEDYGDPYYDRPSRRQSISPTTIQYVYPEVIVRFEPATDTLDFESVSMAMQSIRVGYDDIEKYLERY